MPWDLLSILPVELLHSVSQLSNAAELRSLLLVNRHLNQVFTPLLYTTVIIEDYATAQKCIRTLSRDPSSLVYGRDLPSLVHTLKVAFNRWGLPAGPKAKLLRRLCRAIGRMTSLQHLTFTAVYLCTPKVFAALVHAAAPTLRSLELIPENERNWTDGSDPSILKNSPPTFPELTSVTFSMWDDMPSYWMNVCKHVLADRSAHLRQITIKDHHNINLSRLFCNNSAWSSLVELTLMVRTVPFASLPATPNVRKLRISAANGPGYVWEGLTVPPDAFPELETLECPYQLLPAFLPATARTQRPIRSVRLDDAFYDEDGSDHDYTRCARPEWDDVSKCWDDVAQYMTKLEKLVIVFFQDPGNYDSLGDWGKTLLAYTPKLHTLLLSDAPTKSNGSELAFMFAWDRHVHVAWLAEWDKHTVALRNAAFTSEFVWRKTANGWEASEEKDEDSDGEDEDDWGRSDSGDESEGSVVHEG
ncbi:hypothetical protein BV20DRAFT_409628 [Pilatotrama ljubarskyi]|nr:hypothetical protein BV20DRAFT_409628 [Pilatotrama ljubarskyi]